MLSASLLPKRSSFKVCSFSDVIAVSQKQFSIATMQQLVVQTFELWMFKLADGTAVRELAS